MNVLKCTLGFLCIGFSVHWLFCALAFLCTRFSEAWLESALELIGLQRQVDASTQL